MGWTVKIGRWLRRWWWAFVAGAAAVVGIALGAMAASRRGNPPANPGTPPQRPLRERARDEVERVHLEGEVEKARIQATAEAQHQELDVIEETGRADPVEARRQLASWLQRNL